MKKKWILAGVGALAVTGVLIAARPRGAEDEAPESPFRLGKVLASDLQVSVREVGVVDPVNKVEVKSTVSGRVVAMHVREGDKVKRGDLLAEVEPDVTQAQSLDEVTTAVTQAELRLRDAERALAAQRRLYDNGLLGRESLADFETARDLAAHDLDAAQRRYRIVEEHGIPIAGGGAQRARVAAPMDGVVIGRGVELGETVTSGVSSFNAGTVLFTIADLDSLVIKVNLNEVDIAKVTVGQQARVSLDAYPQRSFEGRVRFVAPAATVVDKIKVFETEIELGELDDAFRTGMSANVEILGDRREQALSVPLEALQRREGDVVAYRLKKDLPEKAIEKARKALEGKSKYTWLAEHWEEYFEPVVLEAGLATLERVEVVAGLAAGDEVALEDPSRRKVERDDEAN